MSISNNPPGVQALLSSVWPDWKVTKRIGSGSYGSVYEIIRDDLGSIHKCALKVLQMDADTSFIPGADASVQGLQEGPSAPQESPQAPKGYIAAPAKQRSLIAPQGGMNVPAGQGILSACRKTPGTDASAADAATTVAPSGRYGSRGSYTAQNTLLEDFVKGVSTEIKFMLRLRGDPHIVSIEDYAILKSPDRCTILIRMENLSCVSKIAASHNGMSRQEVIRLGIDICNALTHCEQEVILHRDIKPSNIFYHGSAGYKLGDFGISRTMDSLYESMSMSGAGTLQYMAPEVYNGSKYNHTADIYSLGLTLYILLNRNMPPFFETDSTSGGAMSTAEKKHTANMRRLRGEPLPAPADADSRLASVLSVACDPRPEFRYSTAAQFCAALKSCLCGSPAEGTSEDVNVKKEDTKNGGSSAAHRSGILPFFITAVIALACLTIGLVLFSQIREAMNPPELVQWSDRSLESAVRNCCGISAEEEFTVQRAEEVTELTLDNCEIYDISALRYFKNLKTLSLAGNHVRDLSPLSDMDKLTDLNLEQNSVIDISPLESLPALQTLNLGMNNVEDASSLGSIASLQKLFLNQTNVTDVNMLEKLPSLEYLDVRHCPITDVSCIHRMKNSTAAQIITADPGMEIPEDALFIAGHSYFVFEPGCSDWDQVLSFCRERGGYPAVIDNYDENEELYRYMLSLDRTAVLFGYTDRVKEGSWVWADDRISYFTDWGENDEGEKEPNSATEEEDYAQFDVHMMRGHWNDCGFGHDTTAFICEWDGFQ